MLNVQAESKHLALSNYRNFLVADLNTLTMARREISINPCDNDVCESTLLFC